MLLSLGLFEPLLCIIHCQFWMPFVLQHYSRRSMSTITSDACLCGDMAGWPIQANTAGALVASSRVATQAALLWAIRQARRCRRRPRRSTRRC